MFGYFLIWVFISQTRLGQKIPLVPDEMGEMGKRYLGPRASGPRCPRGRGGGEKVDKKQPQNSCLKQNLALKMIPLLCRQLNCKLKTNAIGPI